jgi:hypothetical protein
MFVEYIVCCLNKHKKQHKFKKLNEEVITYGSGRGKGAEDCMRAVRCG